MVTDLIPVVDLRFLSQTELAALALSSSNAFDLRRCDDVVVPKIDRSVFNESAGSRKQTYSRFRLASPKPDSPSLSSSLSRRRGRPRSIPLPTSDRPPSDDPKSDPDRRENVLIASFLRQLFSREDPSSQTPPPLSNPASTSVCADEKNDGWKSILAAAEEAQKALVIEEDRDRDRETLNSKGVTVDLLALGRMEDPFGEELRRRTVGLKTEDQILGFLSGVEGQWGSRRKRRRFVDASLFGDVLPRSWKLLLGLKRKEGVAWLDCRRYISPNGHQFVSCQEVSSYILSLQGAMLPVSDRDDYNNPQFDKVAPESDAGRIHQGSISNGSSSFSSPTTAPNVSGNRQKQQETPCCYNATPISYISCENGKKVEFSHQRRPKRRRPGKAIVDGVIIKDGKFECQFCHKIFTERHRYTGHIGAHVRYQGITADLLAGENKAKRSSCDNDFPTIQNDVCLTVQYAMKLNSIPAKGGQYEIPIPKSADGGHLEGVIEKETAIEVKCIDNSDCAFPSANDLNVTPQECFPIVIKEASPSKSVDCEASDGAIINYSDNGNINDKNFEEAMPSTSIDAVPLLDAQKVLDTTAPSSSVSKSFNTSPVPSDGGDAISKMNYEVDIPPATSKPQDVGSPIQENLNGTACNFDEDLNCISMKRTFDDASVDFEVNDGAIVSYSDNGTHDEKIFEEAKPSASTDTVPLFSTHIHIKAQKAPDTTALSASISRSFSISPVPSDGGDVLSKLDNEVDVPSATSKSQDTGSPIQANLNGTACNFDEDLNCISMNRTFDDASLVASDADTVACEAINGNDLPFPPSKTDVLEKSDYTSTNYVSHNAVCTSDFMDVDANSCYDLSLSLMDMDVKPKDKHNGINLSSNLSSEFEKYNDKIIEEIENHSFSLSGNQPSNGCVLYAEDVSSRAVEEHVEKPKFREGRDSSEYFHQLFGKDSALAVGVSCTLQNSTTLISFGSEQALAIGGNTDCPFVADINESVLEEIGKPINELEFFFGRNNSVHEENTTDEIMENDAESKAVHISLSNSSWLQETNVLPVLEMLPDQCGGEMGGQKSNGSLQAFEELRLGGIEPSDFALFTGHDSRSLAEEPSISLGYEQQQQQQQHHQSHCSSFDLSWNISLSAGSFACACVCVWCNSEFRHDHGISADPNSETIAFICPSCKAKFSAP